MRQHLLIVFPVLLTWGLVPGTFLPWFEYRTTWDPPKGSEFALQGKKMVTYEQMRLYELGPELYPMLQNSDSTGCYVAGTSFLTLHPWNPRPANPLRRPYRLHVSNLTDFQTYSIRITRLVALLLLGVNSIINLIFCGINLKKFVVLLINLRLHWYTRLLQVIGFVLLLAICLFGLLLVLGPIVGRSLVVDPLPGWQTCQTTPAYTPTGSGYDLAEWKLNRVLYWGPGLMTLGIMLTTITTISWFRDRK